MNALKASLVCLVSSILVSACATTGATTDSRRAATAERQIVAAYGERWDAISKPPDPVWAPPPIFPYAAWREQKTGSVRVVFRIDAAGAVADLRSFDAGDPGFANAAMAALSKWRYPAQAGGPYRLLFSFGPIRGNKADIHWQ